MKLVQQRGVADCGIASLATLLEQTYEDVYLAASTVEGEYRGKSGLNLWHLIHVAKRFAVTLELKTKADLESDEGLLVVNWPKGSKRRGRGAVRQAHMVALAHGVIVDPADGLILPADDYLTREHGRAGSFLELR